MDWYYTQNKQRLGPVDQKTFEQLVSRGDVRAETLVWRKGLQHWVPYSTLDLLPAPVPAPDVIPNSAAPTGPSCFRCGGAFAADDLVTLGGRTVCAGCKSVELQSLREGLEGELDSETIRKEHIAREVSVKTLGIVHLLAGTTVLILLTYGFVNLEALKGQKESRTIAYGMLLSLPLSAFHLWTGWGLITLSRPARTGAIVSSCLGLVLFPPFGAVIGGLFLYVLCSKKGKMVFSDDYKCVIKEAPHIKYRRSLLRWIVLLIVISLILGLFYAIMNRATD